MRNTVLPYLLLSLFASASLPLNAATQPMAEPLPTAVIEQQASLLDLNKADVTTLQSSLTGIGRSKAEAIVAYRNEHGPFSTVDELLEVKGIGKALLDRNRDKLTVK
ncbi:MULTISPECIES: ComEA family DNA-binding protein [Pseudomonas]|jgi:competence protein ComEA|uniref:Competence protein ComEA n=1 Tax=Pseudomonas fluorescens TaxID=294 RepID=A0A5E6TZU0_PSEFL|nr:MULTISPECIES: helix-hairpin-helix domain-containing protein [Pseudomonas]VVM98984.1 hypothetical protein PS652_03189 [Pseudomonas fluorescens]